MVARYGAVFTFGCMELSGIKKVRRLITRHGGIYTEYYAPPGISWSANFRFNLGLIHCCTAMAEWENKIEREANGPSMPPVYVMTPGIYIYEWCRLRPRENTRFTIVDHTGPEKRVFYPCHPIDG